MRSDKLRWGLIGTGSIATAFAKDLALSKLGKVVAVGSRSKESADRFADELNVPNRHSSYEALMEDADVDVVYIATPHPMHHPNALLALAAGKPVLVEKPLAMNSQEARELVSTARAKGLFLMEAMWTRFLPHIAEINHLLTEGALGEILLVMADHGQWFPRDPAHRSFAPELGGGALLDLGVYPMSFASMVLGKPVQIKTLITPAFTGVDGQTSMVFGYENGAQSVLTCSSLTKTPTRASIVGTDSRIEVDSVFFAPTSFSLVDRNGRTTGFSPPHTGSGLHYEADEVARCLNGGLQESALMPLDESISIMETIDAVLAAR